jgi:hypothetical protein
VTAAQRQLGASFEKSQDIPCRAQPAAGCGSDGAGHSRGEEPGDPGDRDPRGGAPNGA